MLNIPHMVFDEPCDGWHLTSIELMATSTREFLDDKLVGASAHNLIEAKHAEKISVDYISLSPINETPHIHRLRS